ncbi:hypothetical protein [Roseomonas xinghualingensis]|uniref:hypothetical protein n=1 Tax=Roseomonas xinghualingensis TaxID=2986475 RepID=UPI0021F12C0A|nr:hypothetical protein [Roseomonas sp. SXEYE001]MCV4210408.1 hypothetical protein [Roseomonas sp. SXEYE001]
MSNAGFGWDRNWVRHGRLTAGSQVNGLGVGNLQNDHGSPSMGWQTVGTGSWFEIDMGVDVPWRAFVLARTNLTPLAAIRWQVSNSAGALVYDSGEIPAGVVPGIGQSVHILGGEVAGSICRCYFGDPSNPDGFVNIALAYAGPLTQTKRNFSYGASVGRTQAGADVRSRGGALFRNLHWAARRWDVQFAALTDAEVWPLVMALDLHARRGGNVLFVPRPNHPDVARETIYGTLTTTSDPTLTDYSRRDWRATIEERL